ncbi:DUF4232 domain-containing protein [Streptomyces sp. H27-D2]|uniref:DUF4232 domain-containing protein n=1 Tax=Streptomyces sp. H27-D2 TaxID=3046304 RepID=UPI002DBC7996|nr:DUF4232 domain-containing protein [Streptomyces sp. H27-D2]MEC4014952.1 DUF4232 domain-containing protein [Streptomyces sp. H27-D2]
MSPGKSGRQREPRPEGERFPEGERRPEGEPSAADVASERDGLNVPDEADEARAATEPPPAGGEPSVGGGPSGLDHVDEDGLRRLFQGVVQDIEPSPDTLEHLRRAVPARRTRRRHALVGAAAAALLAGTAVPALVHVANTGEGPNDHPANAASSRRTHGAAEGPGESGAGKDGKKPSDKETKGSKKDERKKDKGEKHGPGRATGGTGSTDPSSTMAATSPSCSRDQLGNGSGSAAPADAEGRVYGTFRVVNTSGDNCTVDGAGAVGVSTMGSAEASRIQVVDHTAGDAATGLPDTAPGQVILQPGQAYEVKFAWIPADGGGASGCDSPGPTPTPGASEGTTDGTASEPAGDGGTGDGGETGGGQPPATVVLSHTPEVGQPSAADATIPDACAGTIYRTGVLAAP